MTSDTLLLRQYARHRDAGAFRELSARYAGLVYGTCLRVLGNPADAEDVAQECFLELARKAGAIHTSLPGWLYALARSRAIDLARREATRRRYEEQAAGQSEPSNWVELEPYIGDDLTIFTAGWSFASPAILNGRRLPLPRAGSRTNHWLSPPTYHTPGHLRQSI